MMTQWGGPCLPKAGAVTRLPKKKGRGHNTVTMACRGRSGDRPHFVVARLRSEAEGRGANKDRREAGIFPPTLLKLFALSGKNE